MIDLLLYVLTTLGIIGIINNVKNKKGTNKIKYRQSHIHKIIGPYLPDFSYVNGKNTQSKKHMKENIIDVLVTDKAAYWVHKDVFYTAIVDEDGSVDRSTASQINFDNMSEEEVKKMFIILDKLKDRSKNEGRSTRNE